MLGRLGALTTLSLLAPPAVTTTWVSKSVNKENWYKLSVTYPKFSSTPLANLANNAISTAALTELNDVKKSAGTTQPRVPSELLWKTTVGTATPNLISAYANIYEFEGGAHGISVLRSFNYMMIAGKAQAIKLGNIMRVRMAPVAFASNLLLPKIKKLPNASMVTNGTITSLTADQANNFVITPAGITWLFNQGDLGSMAEGTAMVKVPWSDLKGNVSIGN